MDWRSTFPSSNGQFLIGQDNDAWSNILKNKTLRSLSLSWERSRVSRRNYTRGKTPHLCFSGLARYLTVPYSLRPTVEGDLKCLENEGKPVEVSYWATSIVCVSKTDESVRICGNFKGTVNPLSNSDGVVSVSKVMEDIQGRVSSWKK